MNSHKVIVKAHKYIQTNTIFDTDCLSFHATEMTWLKEKHNWVFTFIPRCRKNSLEFTNSKLKIEAPGRAVKTA